MGTRLDEGLHPGGKSTSSQCSRKEPTVKSSLEPFCTDALVTVRKQRRDAMQLIEAERGEYVQRLVAIRTWVQELARDFAHVDLSVEIDGEEPALIRTSHTVRVRSAAGEEAVVLTKEEFWNEFELFERSAVPRLQAALKRLQPE